MNNKIKEFRKFKNITQEELAKRLSVTRQTVNAIEQGKYSPSLELAFKISRYFEKDIEEMFSY